MPQVITSNKEIFLYTITPSMKVLRDVSTTVSPDHVLHEIIIEVYRALGNFRSDFSDEGDYFVGRGHFYEFLKSNILLLQQFLDDSCPRSSIALDANDVLRMVDPAKILPMANKCVHELTYDDVFTALEILRGNNPAEATLWEGLVSRLTGRTNICVWKGDFGAVKLDCLLKRDRMAMHQFCKKSEEFEAKCAGELKRQHYKILAEDGFTVPTWAVRRLEIGLSIMAVGLVYVYLRTTRTR